MRSAPREGVGRPDVTDQPQRPTRDGTVQPKHDVDRKKPGASWQVRQTR